MMLVRRLRGIGVAILVGAAACGLLGLVVGIAIVGIFRLGDFGGITIGSSPPIPGGLPGILAVLGAILGAINGLMLALLLLAAERGHAIDRIPWWRFGLWGAAATGAAAWLATQTLEIAATCAVLGGVAGIAALALAKRPPV